MQLPSGTHRIGPASASLRVHTTRTGAAAKAGHDLEIEVELWKATLVVADDPAQTTLELTADGNSLHVVEGHGGVSELGDDDKANIKATIDDEILKGEQVRFRSTQVSANGDGLRVDGDLTLAGTVHPISFEVTSDGNGGITANAVVTQTQWGIKPYSTLFGTLKVGDEVQISVDGRLAD
jgi:polyisoprenoid-binding protein YceI